MKDFDDSERQAFGWVLRDVFRLFSRAWNRRLKDVRGDITPPQSQILGALKVSDGLTQTELADEAEMEKAPLGRHLDRMEQMGLIERRPDPTDRRVRRVYYSANAEALEPEMWRAAFDMFEVALGDLTVKERRTLLSLLGRLKQNLLDAEMHSGDDNDSVVSSRGAVRAKSP